MFWIFAVLLVALVLAMILPTLLKKTEIEVDDRRGQNIQIAKEQLAELETAFSNDDMEREEYLSRRDELEQSLYTDVSGLEDDKTIEYAKPTIISAAVIALLIPLIGAGMYAQYGNPQATDPETARVASKVPMTADGKPDVDAMVLGLRKKLEAEPNNPEGWYMMGRSYMALKRYDGAVEAYEKLLELQPKDAKAMLFLADAAAMANKGNVAGRPAELIEKSLEIEPNNITGLWLGGMSAQQQEKHEQAIQRWTTLIPLLGNDAKQVSEVRSLIARSKEKLSPEAVVKAEAIVKTAPIAPQVEEKTAPQQAPTVQATTEGVDPQSIVITLSLSEEMKSKAAPTDTVFVYAKALAGPPMPLAAQRLQVKDLPTTITLDDSTAMMPAMKLSAFPQVIIGARVSKSGNAISANGDLYIEKKPIDKGTKHDLVINQVLVK